jgi:hypothetical protein
MPVTRRRHARPYNVDRAQSQREWRARDRKNGIGQLNVRLPVKWCSKFRQFAELVRDETPVSVAFVKVFPKSVEKILKERSK